MYNLSLFLASLVLLSYAALGDEVTPNQDGAPDLPWSDINLLVITDDHSWIGGHGRKDSYLNADFGAVLSFYENLKAYSADAHKDLFFVMNGDWIDGTGLSLDGDISHLVPLIQKMPFDVVNTGNHECTYYTGLRWFILYCVFIIFVKLIIFFRLHSSVQVRGSRTNAAAKWIH